VLATDAASHHTHTPPPSPPTTTPPQQGIQPEVRTYNTIITACNKSSRPEEGLAIYERMVRAGVKPTATTYTALISAYGKQVRFFWGGSCMLGCAAACGAAACVCMPPLSAAPCLTNPRHTPNPKP